MLRALRGEESEASLQWQAGGRQSERASRRERGSFGADSHRSSPAGLIPQLLPHPGHSFYAVVTALPMHIIRLLATSPCSSISPPVQWSWPGDGKERREKRRVPHYVTYGSSVP